MPCPTHSGRRAHKNCHLCRKPFCRLCMVRMRGEVYCSTRCARDAGRNAAWRRIHASLARPVAPRLVVLAVALAAGVPGALALRTVRELDSLNTLAATARWHRAASASPRVPAPAATPVEPPAPILAAATVRAPIPIAPARRLAPTLAPPPLRLAAAVVPAARDVPPPPPLRAGLSAPDLTRGPSDRAEVLVSFDGGSSDAGASTILDALSARGIRTTIFLTGEFIRRYPALVRRIAAEGHEVGNHTDTHPHLTTYASDGRQATRLGVDRAFLTGQLARTAALYREATGRTMAPLWRAPFGEHNTEIRRWAAEAGYWHVGWTGGRDGLDGLDWVSDPRSRAYQSSDRLLGRLVRHAENGGIVLLHLGSDRDEPVSTKIGALFDGLTARGFAYARASEFLQRQGFDETRLAAFQTVGGSLTR